MIDLNFPSFMTKLNYSFSIYWWLKTYMLWAISRYIYYVCPANSHQTCVQCYNSSNLGQTWFLSCISMIYAILNYLFLIFGSILFTLWQFLNSLINSKIGPFWLPICQKPDGEILQFFVLKCINVFLINTANIKKIKLWENFGLTQVYYLKPIWKITSMISATWVNLQNNHTTLFAKKRNYIVTRKFVPEWF